MKGSSREWYVGFTCGKTHPVAVRPIRFAESVPVARAKRMHQLAPASLAESLRMPAQSASADTALADK